MKKFIIAFTILLIVGFYDLKKDTALQKSLTSNLGLKLRGVIKEKDEEERGKGYGILRVEIIETNISNYDKRGQEPYFCYIHGNEAFFYINSRRAMVGDTIIVNTDSTYALNSRGERSFPIQGITWGAFWKKVKESGN